MRFEGFMLVVQDMEKSKKFYTEILGAEIEADLGVNVSFKDGFALQTEASWAELTKASQSFFRYGDNSAELYFEEENIEEFIQSIKKRQLPIIGDELTMPWGQKVIRFYDPDQHIIEVAEDFTVMIRRLAKEGLSPEAIASQTYLTLEAVEAILNTEAKN